MENKSFIDYIYITLKLLLRFDQVRIDKMVELLHMKSLGLYVNVFNRYHIFNAEMDGKQVKDGKTVSISKANNKTEISKATKTITIK